MTYGASAEWVRFMGELLALEPGTQNGGIFANKSGYHNTRANHLKYRPSDYSIQATADKMGPPDVGAAGDWTFPDAQAGRYATISKYMSRIIASAKDPNDPRLNGWREAYGQADGDLAVEGWDFQAGVPVTSDSSHLWHIHFSELRKYADNWDNKLAMLSVLRGETVEQWMGDDMSALYDNESWSGDEVQSWANRIYRSYRAAESADKKISTLEGEVRGLQTRLDDMSTKMDAILAKLGDGE